MAVSRRGDCKGKGGREGKGERGTGGWGSGKWEMEGRVTEKSGEATRVFGDLTGN